MPESPRLRSTPAYVELMPLLQFLILSKKFIYSFSPTIGPCQKIMIFLYGYFKMDVCFPATVQLPRVYIGSVRIASLQILPLDKTASSAYICTNYS